MNRKTTTCLIAMLLLCAVAYASAISFSGGYTKVSMKEGNRQVSLTQGATIISDEMDLKAETIELYGENYSFVDCQGTVSAELKDKGIILTAPSLFYDRSQNTISADSWVEIQDMENQAVLSAQWFRFEMDSSLLTLHSMARIIKDTDEGLMVCRADSIELDTDSNILTMDGNANIEWNGDTYSADTIVVDLNTNEISMYGSISGVVNA